jgi:hypothetical protein
MNQHDGSSSEIFRIAIAGTPIALLFPPSSYSYTHHLSVYCKSKSTRCQRFGEKTLVLVRLAIKQANTLLRDPTRNCLHSACQSGQSCATGRSQVLATDQANFEYIVVQSESCKIESQRLYEIAKASQSMYFKSSIGI